MKRLIEKVAIVTGAASGIGRSSAILFAQEGARVVLADINAEGLQTVIAEIKRTGGEATAVATDVTDPDSVRELVSKCVSVYGKIDVLYNNAGGSTPRDGSVVDVDLEEFWRAIKLDLFGTFLGCRYAIPYMTKAGGGSIINMTSNVALMGVPGVDCYTAAKGGVASLTRSLAVTHGPSKIRVNAIAPSTTLSPRVIERLRNNESMRGLASRNLLGDAVPDDIAMTALYLATNESRMITGAVLAADGGTTISQPSLDSSANFASPLGVDKIRRARDGERVDILKLVRKNA